MERIKKNFGIAFHSEQMPFFQIAEGRKLCIPLELLQQKPLLAKHLVAGLFKRDSKIDVSFLKSYIPHGHTTSRYDVKISLHHTIDIRNWKEQEFEKDYFKDILRYITIEDVKSDEVYRYLLSLLRGKKAMYVGFYNDDYFMQANSDEVVIISRHDELIPPIQELLEQ
ncbi:hypothetical protein NCCP2716_08770 [Sporosarcina sp. NCCP-2716]|uniref:hypothetical protein n=1 Tax=Sporosarcina sp. NCCP-2716 TaxID=2943679 RepID=UPI00203C3FB9|nr:hypothetical protein [Sporosarcina sp. NCCP-2716]GKV68379.1 hypothetical protein NCCP2716_08770 [Sporosarcina sp. NCCP-2716]